MARHIPWVWGRVSPRGAIVVRERAGAAGRTLYPGLRTIDVPDEPVAGLRHAATLLRDHRAGRRTGARTGARTDARTDEPAVRPYDADELDELVAGLEPIAAAHRRAVEDWIDGDGPTLRRTDRRCSLR